MFNPDTAPVSAIMPSFETAARSLKVVPIMAPVHSDVEIETAIIALGREPGGGLVSLAGGFMLAHRAPIISAAARNNVPAVYNSSDFARDGGLLSYGPGTRHHRDKRHPGDRCRPAANADYPDRLYGRGRPRRQRL